MFDLFELVLLGFRAGKLNPFDNTQPIPWDRI
jgi:hypothetical protein